MIDLDITQDKINSYFKLFSEGMISDVLKDATKVATNVDIDKVREEWDNAETLPDKMGTIRDTARQVNSTLSPALDKARKAITPHYGKSIIARAKNSILQFPVYITNSIRVNEAQIIGKLFERVYANLVQSVLAQNPIINEEDVNSLGFLKNFHTNISESTNHLINNYYEAIDNLDQMMCDSIFYTESITPDIEVQFKLVPTTNEDLIAENSRLANEPLKGLMNFTEDSDNSTTIEGAVLPDSEFRAILRRHNKENPDKPTTMDELKKLIRSGKEVKDLDGNRIIYHRQMYFKKGKEEIKTKTSSREIKKPDSPVELPRMLRDQDIKKLNSLLPYTMEAMFKIKSSNTEVRFLIGVKTIMHIIQVEDFSRDLRNIVMGQERTLQKVRYKTGEISFKDYFFNIKSVKADASKYLDHDKRWINTLKRLGDYKKMVGPAISDIAKLTNGNFPIPNATMILEQSDIAKIKNETGIDLENPSNIQKLAHSLFLIAFVVIDITAGTLKSMFPDESLIWDIQSLASIDAEVSRADNSPLLKELNKVINR